jgi:DNA polymerase III delta subunit
MPRWIDERARELGIRLGRGAAAELARRVGALARGGDINRRNQGQLAVAELEKLSLLHVDGGEITPEDVAALVVETVPHSAFEFLDAFGERRTRQAAEQFDRLIQTAPEPVVVAQLYSRIRQLLEVTDRIAGGEDPRTVVRETKLNPYVAQKLAAMAPRWTVPELRRALDGLFGLDVLVKGADGGTSTEEERRLAFTLWLAETLGGS